MDASPQQDALGPASPPLRKCRVGSGQSQNPEAEEYNRVRDDVESYSRENWPEAALPPNGKFSESAAFAPGTDDLMVLKQHYREERDLFFVEPPSFETILERLQSVTKNI